LNQRKRFIYELQVSVLDNELGIITKGMLITKRGFIANLILFISFYTSYFVFSLFFIQYVIPSDNNRLIAQASFNFIIAIICLSTSFLINRVNKLRVIYICSITISIVAVLLFFTSNYFFSIAFILIIAIFFGLGQLAFFTYFWNLTAPEERGRIAGLIGFVTLFFYLFVDLAAAETLDFFGTVILGIILSLGTLLVILLSPEKALLTEKKDDRGNYPEKRTIILYLIPWVLFSLINATIAKNISLNVSQTVPNSLYSFLIVLQLIAALFGTLGGGIIADFYGRRFSLVLSLTLYGISSALAGIANNYAIFYFVYVANGLSWGILLTLYNFVVWGDLANKENCAKMYSIGLITFYFSVGLGLLLSQTLQMPLVVSALSSCVLIFLANIPIVVAPELLSSDFRERIRLKLHINAVKKIKQSRNQG
jgi:MFS family permease